MGVPGVGRGLGGQTGGDLRGRKGRKALGAAGPENAGVRGL